MRQLMEIVGAASGVTESSAKQVLLACGGNLELAVGTLLG